MARAFWKGAINFGMVVIPVKMYVATQSEKPGFHMLHKKDLSRVKQVLYCPADDEYINYSDTVKGYEYARGQYVVLSDKDLENIPLKTNHTIDVLSFTNIEDIDPIYYYDAHYLEPEDIGARPYSLLCQALGDAGLVGIAKVAFQKQEHLCCLRASGRVLVLHTLHFQHEVRSSDDLDIPSEKLKSEELKMAGSLINEMKSPFDPSKYKDKYRQALNKLIQAKLEGKETIAPARPEAPRPPELLDALRESVQSKKKEREKAGAKS